MPRDLNDPAFVAAVADLTPDLGPAAAVAFSKMGLPTAYARQLHSAPVGRRLLGRDPSGMLDDVAVSAVLGVSLSTFAQWVNGEKFPAPDDPGGGVERVAGTTRPKSRKWSAGTVGRWLGAGCPGADRRPNAFIAGKVGATPA